MEELLGSKVCAEDVEKVIEQFWIDIFFDAHTNKN